MNASASHSVLPLSKARVAMLREMGLPVQLWEARLAQQQVSTAVPAVAVAASSGANIGARPPMPSVAAPAAPRVPPTQLHSSSPARLGTAKSNASSQAQQLQASEYPARSAEQIAAIAAMDSADLNADMLACRACGLCQTRRHVVPGVGDTAAQVLILGEAPGEQEDMQGEPFVGAAGKLLDNMLMALRDADANTVSRQQKIFIANTLKCRPPGNRNPLEAELAACAPYWQRQIALLQPKIILALGRFAVQALLGRSEALGRLRGQTHYYQDIPVIVSYHPAYLLRSPSEKGKAWADLCLLMQTWHERVRQLG